jgi:rhodanese-related sulfurtransferase
MHRLGMKIRTNGVCATTLLVALALASHPSHARDWMPAQVRTAAEAMLATMPDDWFTIKDVAAEKEIATGMPLVLDVREPAEFAAEHIPRSKNISIRLLLKDAQALPADKAAPILVYCKTGHRGAVALAALRMVGYSNVRSIYGGLEGWKAAGFPVPK